MKHDKWFPTTNNHDINTRDVFLSDGWRSTAEVKTETWVLSGLPLTLLTKLGS